MTAFSASLINVAEENETFSSLDGVLFNKDKTVLLRFPEIQQRRYDIPEGVVELGDYAFSDCNLSSIYMPEGLTVIGEKAFEYSFNLYDVNFPSTLQRIEDQAFSGCTLLKNISAEEYMFLLTRGWLLRIGEKPLVFPDKWVHFFFGKDIP